MTKPANSGGGRLRSIGNEQVKPFLYLDNWHEPQPETRFDKRLRELPVPVETVRTNDGEFPSGTDYCGAYVSPSFDGAYDDLDWIHREHEVLRGLAAAGVPMVGLCFGSQILASALVGKDQVSVRDRKEAGYGEIRLTSAARKDLLTSSLPERMPVFHWHGDEVGSEHPDMIVLAESDDCANQAWRWAKGRIWGIQPHPEFDAAGLIDWFDRYAEMFERHGLLRGDLVKDARGCDDAFNMLENFLESVVMRQTL